MKVSYSQVKNELQRVLEKYGFDQDSAEESATIFADNTADGVPSHGINRFPRVVSYIEQGYIDVKATPHRVLSLGALEKWDGNLGMGNLNAKRCMDRAIVLAQRYGIGAVALRNTNHWMRGGTYGRQAAEAGFVGMCWTNTLAGMPAWGAKDSRVGNNPFIVAVPRKDGHIVVDAAMAQYSYGKIEASIYEGKQLPYPGGYDEDGNLTTDPAKIRNTRRVLPIGFWKGSGFAIAFDLIAATVAEGNSTVRIGKLGAEIGLSQMFIAINLKTAAGDSDIEALIDETIADIKSSTPIAEQEPVMYPGEPELKTRHRNLQGGIDIEDSVWEAITAM